MPLSSVLSRQTRCRACSPPGPLPVQPLQTLGSQCVIGLEDAVCSHGHCAAGVLLHAASHHAHVCSLAQHQHARRLEAGVKGAGYLVRQPLLYLQPPAECPRDLLCQAVR